MSPNLLNQLANKKQDEWNPLSSTSRTVRLQMGALDRKGAKYVI
ncbi:hypothetical protein [Spirosoma horti]